MTCPECGAPIPDNSASCPHCGSPVRAAGVSPTTSTFAPYQTSANVCPETHLTKAILLTLLCCWPFGIPAIINAAGVENAFRSGDYALAVEKSEKASKWCNTTLIVGIIFWVLYAILMIILVLLDEL